MGLPLIMLGVGVAGAAVSAYGSAEAGAAGKASADYQAQVARNNAMIAQQNATWTAESGESKVAAQGMKTAANVGTAKAAQGASNIDVNSGSASDVRTSEAKLGALDALTIRSNSAREAYGYEVTAGSETAKAGLLQGEGEQAQTAGDIGALSSFLSGASSVGSKYQMMQLGAG